MKAKIILIFIQIIFVYSYTIYPAEEIWISLKYRAAMGMMVYNKNYFIYDDKNYTKLYIKNKIIHILIMIIYPTIYL